MSTPDLKNHIENICADLRRRQASVLPALKNEFKDANQDVETYMGHISTASSTRKTLRDEIAKELARSDDYVNQINKEKEILGEFRIEYQTVNKMIADERKLTRQKVDNFNSSINELSSEFRETPSCYKPDKLIEESNQLIQYEQKSEMRLADLVSMIAEFKNAIIFKNDEDVSEESLKIILEESKEADLLHASLDSKLKYMNKMIDEISDVVAQLKMRGFDNIYPMMNN